MIIEKQEVAAASCACGHTDYTPAEDEAMLGLPGFQVIIVHEDMRERGYACKTAHVARVGKSLAEKLYADLHPKEDKGKGDVEQVADEPTGLLAS